MFTHICRACVGRNFAFMQLLIIISSVFRRFDIVLEYPDKPVSQPNHCAGLAVADNLIAQDKGGLYKEATGVPRGVETTFHIAGQ